MYSKNILAPLPNIKKQNMSFTKTRVDFCQKNIFCYLSKLSSPCSSAIYIAFTKKRRPIIPVDFHSDLCLQTYSTILEKNYVSIDIYIDRSFIYLKIKYTSEWYVEHVCHLIYILRISYKNKMRKKFFLACVWFLCLIISPKSGRNFYYGVKPFLFISAENMCSCVDSASQ